MHAVKCWLDLTHRSFDEQLGSALDFERPQLGWFATFDDRDQDGVSPTIFLSAVTWAANALRPLGDKDSHVRDLPA